MASMCRFGRRNLAHFAWAALCVLIVPTRSSADDCTERWLHLSTPREGHRVVAIPMVEFRGHLGAGPRPPAKAVVLIDRSRSSLLPAGFDVDGDGTAGTLRRWAAPSGLLSTDAGDTVLQASLLGAGRIIRELVETGTHVTVMKFAERARDAGVVNNPTSVWDVVSHVRALSQLTAIGSAIRAALRSLDEEPTTAVGERWIVLISDGVPTYPPPEFFALRDTLRAAAEAAARGVRIYAFGLGRRHSLLSEVVQLTGGALVQVHDLEDFTAPSRLCLVPGLNAAIVNRSGRAAARAVRIFADGSFDGVVPLVPGDNIVEVSVTLGGGESHTAERRVHFEPRPARTVRELQSMRELRDRLQLRSQETQLLVDTNRRWLLQRSLEIRPDRASVLDPSHPED